MATPEEFDRIMRQEGDRVYLLAVRLTGNSVDGQDLAQETFVKAYQSWSSFRGDSQPSSWFYRICVNLWKNRVRYEKRRKFWKHFSLDGAGDEDERTVEIPAADPPAGSAIDAQDRKHLVTEALAGLDPDDRAILVLRDMEDKSYEDVARILDLPLGTVKSRLARSRAKLYELLAPQLGKAL